MNVLVALENICIDKAAKVPTARNRKIDKSVPMHIGMAAKDDCESLREEGLPTQSKTTKRRKPIQIVVECDLKNVSSRKIGSKEYEVINEAVAEEEQRGEQRKKE